MAALLGGPGVQRVVHLMPCLQHRPPISEGGGSLPCFIQRQTLLQPPALKYGDVNRRADGEEPGIPTIEVVELECFDADPAFQADSWVEIVFGSPYARRFSVPFGFVALFFLSPFSQFGCQPPPPFCSYPWLIT